MTSQRATTATTMEMLIVTNSNANTTATDGDDVIAGGGSDAVADWVKTLLLAVLLFGLSLITSIGNAMVLHAVRTDKRLQTVSNMFIVSLAIADLIVGVIVMPISAAYILLGQWPFGIAVCQLWIGVDYTASTASILNLLVLSMDRYWSVKSPLQYIHKRTPRRALVMISIAWCLSVLWLVPILGWHHFANGGVRTVPSDVCDTEYATNTPLKLVTALVNYYVPLLIMFSIYTKVFVEIRKRSKLEITQARLAAAGKGRDRLPSISETAADDTGESSIFDAATLTDVGGAEGTDSSSSSRWGRGLSITRTALLHSIKTLNIVSLSRHRRRGGGVDGGGGANTYKHQSSVRCPTMPQSDARACNGKGVASCMTDELIPLTSSARVRNQLQQRSDYVTLSIGNSNQHNNHDRRFYTISTGCCTDSSNCCSNKSKKAVLVKQGAVGEGMMGNSKWGDGNEGKGRMGFSPAVCQTVSLNPHAIGCASARDRLDSGVLRHANSNYCSNTLSNSNNSNSHKTTSILHHSADSILTPSHSMANSTTALYGSGGGCDGEAGGALLSGRCTPAGCGTMSVAHSADDCRLAVRDVVSLLRSGSPSPSPTRSPRYSQCDAITFGCQPQHQQLSAKSSRSPSRRHSPSGGLGDGDGSPGTVLQTSAKSSKNPSRRQSPSPVDGSAVQRSVRFDSGLGGVDEGDGDRERGYNGFTSSALSQGKIGSKQNGECSAITFYHYGDVTEGKDAKPDNRFHISRLSRAIRDRRRKKKPKSALLRQAKRWRRKLERHRLRLSASLATEIKAAKQLGVIMGVFTICFLPYFVCFIVLPFCRTCVGDDVMTAVTWFGYVNSTLNPVLYPLCNSNFRRRFYQMLHMPASHLRRNST